METELIYEACEPMRRIIRTNLTQDGLMVILEGLHLVDVAGNRHDNINTLISLYEVDNYVTPNLFNRIKTNPKAHNVYRGISLLLLEESREITFQTKDIENDIELIIGRKFVHSYCELLYNETKGTFEFRIK